MKRDSVARIPAKVYTLDELLLRFGSEEGLVEAFLLHQLSEDDYHVLSPTWMTCCLLRRVLGKLDEVTAAIRGEAPFSGPVKMTHRGKRAGRTTKATA